MNQTRQLSEWFAPSQVYRDGSFATLGGNRTRAEATLAYADSPAYTKPLAANPKITALITRKELAERLPATLGVIVADDPRTTFYELHQRFVAATGYWNDFMPSRGEGCHIHPSALIDPATQIGDGVYIGPSVIIGACTVIESDVRIESGVTLGAEGILYLKGEGGISRLPHGGGVIIRKGATLLANAVVARSVHDSLSTEVGERSIVGIASCIGHEAFIGSDCVVSNNCVIARNAVMEAGAFVGTNAFVRENLTLGANSRVMAGSVVVSSVAAGKTVSGNFAISHEKRLKEYAMQSGKSA